MKQRQGSTQDKFIRLSKTLESIKYLNFDVYKQDAVCKSNKGIVNEDDIVTLGDYHILFIRFSGRQTHSASCLPCRIVSVAFSNAIKTVSGMFSLKSKNFSYFIEANAFLTYAQHVRCSVLFYFYAFNAQIFMQFACFLYVLFHIKKRIILYLCRF